MASVERIRAQLDAEKQIFGYRYVPDDALDSWLTNELATYIAGKGTNDIRDIAEFRGPINVPKSYGTAPDGSPIMGLETIDTRFWYDALTGVQFPFASATKFVSGGTVSALESDFFLRADRGDKHIAMKIRFTADKVPYWFAHVIVRQPSGVFQQLWEAAKPVLPVVAIAFSFLAPGLGATIGKSLLGTVGASASPAIAAAIGNTALGTVFNGGDLEGALKGQLLGVAGGIAGSNIAKLAESPLLGKLAGTAVQAGLAGGDVKAALTTTLLSEGAKMDWFDSWFSSSSSPPAIEPGFFAEGGYGYDPGSASADYFDPVYDAPVEGMVDIDVPVYTDTPDFSITSPSSSGGSWVQDLTQLAMAAIKVNQAYQASQMPQPRTMVQSGTKTQTPNSNGTVTVRDSATGQVYTTRPNAGTPYVLSDGRTIINNGDGTYTLIARDGTSQRLPYTGAPASSGAGGGGIGAMLESVPPAAWAVAGGLAILALRSRR